MAMWKGKEYGIQLINVECNECQMQWMSNAMNVKCNECRSQWMSNAMNVAWELRICVTKMTVKC